MALNNVTTITSAKRRSKKNQDVEMLEFKLRMTTAMLTLLSTDKSSSPLTRSQRLRMGDVARRHNWSMDSITRRAMNLWLAVEAPVYMSN